MCDILRTRVFLLDLPPRWFTLSVLCILCLGWTTSAQASLLMPEMPDFELADGPVDSSNSSAASDLGDEPTPEQVGAEMPFVLDAFLAGTGGMSSTPSVTGGSGISASALDLSGDVLLHVPGVSRWFSGQSRLLLPMPPGNDLLRPPQCRMKMCGKCSFVHVNIRSLENA